LNDDVTRQGEKVAPLPATVPGDGLYRETHLRIRQYPNAAMVTSSDLGTGTHPINKSGYGARAARVALGMVYGRKVEIYGPVYQSHAVNGNRVRIKFTHVGQGLACRGSDAAKETVLQGFAVAGEDKTFHWAEATIEGGTVVVASEKVPEPVAIRYAWSQSHPWANLFNKDGLPALPFRTDAW
jgi:sialate O-acetylesterase